MSDINEIETEARKNRALVVASGHVLIEHFPSDFGEWDEKALDDFLIENVWEPFEGTPPNDLWAHIESIANTILNFK